MNRGHHCFSFIEQFPNDSLLLHRIKLHYEIIMKSTCSHFIQPILSLTVTLALTCTMYQRLRGGMYSIPGFVVILCFLPQLGREFILWINVCVCYPRLHWPVCVCPCAHVVIYCKLQFCTHVGTQNVF